MAAVTRSLLLLGLLVGVGTGVACGEDEPAADSRPAPESSETTGAPTGPGGALEIVASHTRFDRDRYEVPAGEVTITYVEQDESPHTLLIEGADGDDVGDFYLEVDEEPSKTGTVALAPGEYTLYCNVPGHRAAGMEAELVVL